MTEESGTAEAVVDDTTSEESQKSGSSMAGWLVVIVALGIVAYVVYTTATQI